MAVKLALVAEEADVSLPTVSKVLNARPDVAKATRERVTQVLERHGYSIRTRPRTATGLIDVRIVNLDGPWSETVVRGAAAAARRYEKEIVLTVDPDPDDCDGWVRHALSRGTDGLLSVVAVPSEPARAALTEAGVPFVAVDPLHRAPEGTLSISATNFQGAFDATRHLIDLGHRRITTITGPVDQDNGIARLAGYQAAMMQAGLPLDDDLIVRARYGVEEGYHAVCALLRRDARPTGIFAASDDTALGAIRALREHGLRVPADVSVIGFDDVPYSRWNDPPLTTVSQPLTEMGAAAVDIIIGALQGRSAAVHTELSTRLVVRQSTAAPAVER